MNSIERKKIEIKLLELSIEIEKKSNSIKFGQQTRKKLKRKYNELLTTWFKFRALSNSLRLEELYNSSNLLCQQATTHLFKFDKTLIPEQCWVSF
jgi:RNA recognition motif-containing protein